METELGKAMKARQSRIDRGASPSDTVGLYLDEVSEHELLTAEDEVHLARAMEQGKKAQALLESGDFSNPVFTQAWLNPFVSQLLGQDCRHSLLGIMNNCIQRVGFCSN